MSLLDFLHESSGSIGQVMHDVREISRELDEIDENDMDADACVLLKKVKAWLGDGGWSAMSAQWDTDALWRMVDSSQREGEE